MIHHTRQIFPCEMAIFFLKMDKFRSGFYRQVSINPERTWYSKLIWLNGEPAGMGTDTPSISIIFP
jgi:hypothetical protein